MYIIHNDVCKSVYWYRKRLHQAVLACPPHVKHKVVSLPSGNQMIERSSGCCI
jgi:hypothetical protein